MRHFFAGFFFPLQFRLLLFLCLGACVPVGEDDLPADTQYSDADLDGYSPIDGDCDDGDPFVKPGADEACNDQDDDCDQGIDEGFDLDGDGVSVCSFVSSPIDCDDGEPERFPGNAELCDGTDNDCNQLVDDGFDGDDDGYSSCLLVDDPIDCNDRDDSVHPFASPLCDGQDNDCDNDSDEGYDSDNDGFASCSVGGQEADCDDGDNQAYPGKTEVCDGVDNDCDDVVDENFDRDEDGYKLCTSVDDNGYPIPADCDDDNEDVYPGADEICNGLDDDCNAATDDDDDGVLDQGTWYEDVDGDQYGAPESALTTCDPPADFIQLGGDCDDADPDAFPGAIWYPDVDEDGYGDDEGALQQCARPDESHLTSGGDCDDSAAETYEAAPELCDLADNDCDDSVDENLESDLDGDGFAYCTGEGQIVDCDDALDSVYPGAVEICDGQDNNCDGDLDEGFDADADGYSLCGIIGEVLADCDDNDPAINPGAEDLCDGLDVDCDEVIDEGADLDLDGFTTCEGGELPVDCDDDNALIHPNTTWYFDVDGDGYGQEDDSIAQCENPGDPYVLYGDDCDELSILVHPDAPEFCNDRDDDCDEQSDEGLFVDNDQDGFVGCELGLVLDCADDDDTRYPGAEELCDGVDDDCSGGSGDLYVAKGGTGSAGGPYGTIQSAIQAADDDCVIGVGPGIYQETLSFTGDLLSLRSEKGPDNTVIDSSLSVPGPTITIEGQTPFGALIEGFTIIGDNGYTPDLSYAVYGGAVYVGERSSITLKNNIFQDCTADNGGAVACLACRDVTLLRNQFIENTAHRFLEGLFYAYGSGGAVYVKDGELISQENHFELNEAGLYGGSVFLENSDWTSKNDHMAENVSVSGGGVYSKGSELAVESLSCLDNEASGLSEGLDFRAGRGGCLAILEDSYASISLSEMVSNQAGGSDYFGFGGAIRLDESQLSLTHSVVAENQATGSTGGGIDAEECHLTMNNTLFSRNAADYHGTALIVDACADMSIINNTFVDSQSDGDDSAAVSLWGTAGVFYNNIISHTVGGYAFQFSEDSFVQDDVSVDANPEIVQFNDFYSNDLGNVTGDMGVNSNELGNKSVDPLYENRAGSNYFLSELSTLLDGGHPGVLYQDVDGSINEVGMSGGPEGVWDPDSVGSFLEP